MTGTDSRTVLGEARKQHGWWERLERMNPQATQEWWRTLPPLLSSLIEQWGLSEVSVHPNLSYALIYRVRRGGRAGVLKLFPPAIAAKREIAWHRLQAPGRGPEVWATAPDQGALLMEEILPGTSLESLPDDELATRLLARVLRDPRNLDGMLKSDLSPFPSVASLAVSLSALEGRVPAKLIGRGQEILRRPGETLLHGDLHHGNVLLDSENNARVIDPHGLLGPPAFEAAALFRNPQGRDLNASVLARRLEIVAEVTGWTPSEIRDFAFAGTLLSAAWKIEDGEPDPSRDLALAERLAAL